jgi:DNA-binding protein H-NS
MLREQLDGILHKKATEERRRLESQLAALSRVSGGKTKRGGGAMRGATVAPKYRNPENPFETWAGRGLKPRWLAAALKSGMSLEDFSIAAPLKAAGKVSPAKKNKGKKAKR